MNCRELELLLENLGELVGDDAARHMKECPRCSELQAVLNGGLESLVTGPGAAPDLTGDVMRATTGPACGRAEEQLPDLVDKILPSQDAELVSLHLEHCRACGELARTLEWMSEHLPSMAEVTPPASFTAQVIGATSRRRRPFPAIAPILAAARARLEALARRPAFAWEASYAGAIALWVVFSVLPSPLRDIPAQALELARINPVQAIGDTVQPASLGHRMWAATGAPILSRAQPVRSAWAERLSGAALTTQSLGGHATQALGAAVEGDFSGSFEQIEQIGSDLQTLWNEMLKREPAKNSNAQEA
jgi:anti-sigma factor RsiW